MYVLRRGEQFFLKKKEDTVVLENEHICKNNTKHCTYTCIYMYGKLMYKQNILKVSLRSTFLRQSCNKLYAALLQMLFY